VNKNPILESKLSWYISLDIPCTLHQLSENVQYILCVFAIAIVKMYNLYYVFCDGYRKMYSIYYAFCDGHHKMYSIYYAFCDGHYKMYSLCKTHNIPYNWGGYF
jgi:hypothetical protein